jgi:hypothetical protein
MASSININIVFIVFKMGIFTILAVDDIMWKVSWVKRSSTSPFYNIYQNFYVVVYPNLVLFFSFIVWSQKGVCIMHKCGYNIWLLTDILELKRGVYNAQMQLIYGCLRYSIQYTYSTCKLGTLFSGNTWIYSALHVLK